MSRIILAALAAALAGCGNIDTPQRYSGQPGEFVCYTGGALSERHVLVTRARLRRGHWLLDYSDGGMSAYLPQRGESCGLERVR